MGNKDSVGMGSIAKVSIVDDDPSVRMSLRLMVEKIPGYSVVSLHERADHALAAIPNLLPEIVFMDIRMPGKSGIQCTRELKEIVPALKIVIVTAHLADALIADAFHAGAIGYVVKPVEPGEIARALHCARRGEIYLKGPVSERFSNWMQNSRRKPMVLLTEREIEVLNGVKEGLLDREIAIKLDVRHSTVRAHVRNILAKLDARSRVQAVSKYFGYF